MGLRKILRAMAVKNGAPIIRADRQEKETGNGKRDMSWTIPRLYTVSHAATSQTLRLGASQILGNRESIGGFRPLPPVLSRILGRTR
jgi:hypothetical protein